jgi:hypothetical protein
LCVDRTYYNRNKITNLKKKQSPGLKKHPIGISSRQKRNPIGKEEKSLACNDYLDSLDDELLKKINIFLKI